MSLQDGMLFLSAKNQWTLEVHSGLLWQRFNTATEYSSEAANSSDAKYEGIIFLFVRGNLKEKILLVRETR